MEAVESMERGDIKLGVERNMYFMSRFVKKRCWDFWLLDLAFN